MHSCSWFSYPGIDLQWLLLTRHRPAERACMYITLQILPSVYKLSSAPNSASKNYNMRNGSQEFELDPLTDPDSHSQFQLLDAQVRRRVCTEGRNGGSEAPDKCPMQRRQLGFKWAQWDVIRAVASTCFGDGSRGRLVSDIPWPSTSFGGIPVL